MLAAPFALLLVGTAFDKNVPETLSDNSEVPTVFSGEDPNAELALLFAEDVAEMMVDRLPTSTELGAPLRVEALTEPTEPLPTPLVVKADAMERLSVDFKFPVLLSSEPLAELLVVLWERELPFEFPLIVNRFPLKLEPSALVSDEASDLKLPTAFGVEPLAEPLTSPLTDVVPTLLALAVDTGYSVGLEVAAMLDIEALKPEPLISPRTEEG